MQIEIEGKTYLLQVKEKYMNIDKEIVEEIIPLDEWAEIVRKKAVSSLFHIEEVLTDLFGKSVRLTEDYPEIKKPILNLSGSVSRLPSQLIVELLEDK